MMLLNYSNLYTKGSWNKYGALAGAGGYFFFE
jgi:hypothetical protein